MTRRAPDPARWQALLDELLAAHRVPGAALAVLVDGEVHELAGGVLHQGTGVAATPDSVFQLGSIAKVYTASLVMRLADSGALDLDAPVRDVLPDFAVADPGASASVTPRQLLSHTSGISGDFTLDTGRGDDCLARYVEACRDVPLDCPPGTAASYSSTGYNVLGRIVEVLTGRVWDRALKELLLDPLGLEQTMTLPEEVLRFRAAMSHLGGPGGRPEPAPEWNAMPRSSGPYGGVCATAGDVVRLARMHLDGGTAPDGTRVLSPGSTAEMRRRAVRVPDRWTVGADGWGLGWTLYDWDGVPGFGHDGATLGQYSYLRAVPEAGVAAALLTNGGAARRLSAGLFRELLAELAGVRTPEPFGPPARPPAIDPAPFVGAYLREGVTTRVAEHPGGLRLVYELTGGMAAFSAPIEVELVPVARQTAPGPDGAPVTETVFAASGAGTAFNEDWMPVVFSTLPDGTPYVSIGMRTAPKEAPAMP
ncbi:serine hydrolase domain-containing protein [Nocardiopsis potens]|uniref:serine hydrolase domain-containing protein n=1 Tax=Nocardiopsis potens TaxID=1246458 RepID=UPI000344EB87|nr:serine hydrolase domain-containing protein [Nocardiopsis potens]